jgi:hypothetical protein
MKQMKLHSITAVFMLAILLVASLGGVMCEASCVPLAVGPSAHHACCPAEGNGNSLHAGIGVSTACDHPSHEQVSLLTAPVFVAPLPEMAAMLSPVHFTFQIASPAVPAASSPPAFHLRI